MALELMLEKNANDYYYEPFKADVYIYAITCFEMLTRKVPFPRWDVNKNRSMIKAGARPRLPTSLPTFLLWLIKQCWDVNVTRRFLEICAKLRHLKGLCMIEDFTSMMI
jgi:serine/threonine protein kinase